MLGAIAYELKVTLRGTKPPIWRRLEVKADTRLFEFHQILQVAMGWTDSHMHQFVAKGKCYGAPDPGFLPDRENEKKVRLDQVLRKPKDRMIYEYDFGDSWEHEVVVERVMPAEPGPHRYPSVTAGKRACPPEDCGGIPGFYHFLEAIQNPDHPDHEDMLEWWGGRFEPEAFDVQKANRAFHGGWGPARP
ncbi:MAG: plasmid pRiA4b ORF-3 family protein [Candidatus Methylomirabilales bacterium]